MASSIGRLDYIGKVKSAIDLVEGLGLEEAPDVFERLLSNWMPITTWGPMVWSAPVLHNEECDQLVEFAKNNKQLFTPNAQEGKDYRIDELVLINRDKLLHERTSFLAWHRLAPLFQLMMGRRPERTSSIQLARFTPESTAQTDWHVDEESEMTCVISLAPENHEGGGTRLRPHGPGRGGIYVPPLPKGHGLFFNGRMVYHKAEPVYSGERLLLVYWMMGGGLAVAPAPC